VHRDITPYASTVLQTFELLFLYNAASSEGKRVARRRMTEPSTRTFSCNNTTNTSLAMHMHR
jgi:hypothetical protein